MIQNLHTHSNFCDGKNTLEETVLSAIDKGFFSLGFSGHSLNEYDLEFCMTDVDGYISEVKRLKEKYKSEIEIYLGIEEDRLGYVVREEYEYIIGACHSFLKDGRYYPIDKDKESFDECLRLFGNDHVALAKDYYSTYCDYILARKPDIVAHFDLITKFDELGEPIFANNEKYFAVAEKYLEKAIKSGCLFEVNTGAISRGYRKTPYPHPRLLHLLKKKEAGIVLTSDCHAAENLDCHFEETKRLLRDIGFDGTYILQNGKWRKEKI